ncbi:SDR family NAD(P)-dependent oxidoreductase [Acetobacteraceae bacterium ESL0709]|nr:SDR family NAD(P)-dependent oxidoreductase [Acetobacteraceae bacterium ESL0697]MDF7678365.1 SDR family NAD(P)-dependent oxidoreductase [Acetobacteraceae bacterium ESL0709]
MTFHGKTALVTDSTTGIGEAVADLLCRHGANIVIVSRSESSIARKINALSSASSCKDQKFLELECDISDPEQVRKTILKNKRKLRTLPLYRRPLPC